MVEGQAMAACEGTQTPFVSMSCETSVDEWANPTAAALRSTMAIWKTWLSLTLLFPASGFRIVDQSLDTIGT